MRGLSPLARGTLEYYHSELPVSRFIPAGAGNTHTWQILHFRRAVYPRWRGEHRQIRNQNYNIFGLSPLARGTLKLIGV